jgi:hypothetical protein
MLTGNFISKYSEYSLITGRPTFTSSALLKDTAYVSAVMLTTTQACCAIYIKLCYQN